MFKNVPTGRLDSWVCDGMLDYMSTSMLLHKPMERASS